MKRCTLSAAWVVVTCFGLFAACAPKRQALDVAPKPVAKQDQAASSHVSVISVSRWEEYAEALQPKFVLKPEEALALAVPATMRLEEKFIDALSARLKLAPPVSSETSTATSSQGGEDSSTTTTTTTNNVANSASTVTGSTNSSTGRTLTETDGPGSVSTLAFAPPTTPDVSTIGASGILQGTVALDPMARYAAATALYQEVQLLSRYVRDATIRTDSVPYLVRLQISLLPVLRGQAYDANALISFFSGGNIPVTPNLVVTDASPRTSEPRLVNAVYQPQTPAGKTGAQPLDEFNTDKCPAFAPPMVVPLLVTDNLESAAHSRSLATIREMGLALGLLSGNFAAGAHFDSVQRSLASLVGNDVNGLLTVGRVSDNTLRVRLGAMLQAESRYAMVPRTHNVTVLLFVPRELTRDKTCPPKVRLVARTEITDAVRGRTLESRTPAEIAQRLQGVATRYQITTDAATLERLRVLVQMNDYEQFAKALIDITPNQTSLSNRQQQNLKYAEAIWLELTELLVGSQFSPSTFELPAPADPKLPDPKVRALLLDDGKNAATVTLVGGSHLLASQLSASLRVTEAGTPTAREFVLPATKVDVPENRQVMQFSFRSVAPLVTDIAKVQFELAVSRVAPAWEGTTERTSYRNVQFISVAQPTPAEAPFSVTSGARVIASQDGSGTIQITFKRKPEAQGKVLLTVAGADLSAIQSASPPDSLARSGAEVLVSKDGAAELRLSNLTPESEVEVVLRDEKGVGPAGVRVRVREIQRSQPR